VNFGRVNITFIDDSRMKYKKRFVVKESDCTVVTNYQQAIKIAKNQLIEDRIILEQFIAVHPEWEASFKPIRTKDAPPIIEAMEIPTEIAGVGPMAAVAGALADRMQEAMLKNRKVSIAVIEDGGEIAINSSEDILIALYVLSTALKAQLGFKFSGGDSPIGISTSSAQFSHSISLGEADTVTIFADNTAMADAAATAVCNEVKGPDYEASILKGLEICDQIEGINGAFITRDKFVGKKGKIPELVYIKDGEDYILQEKFQPV
jgi:hypothetical protein